MYTRNFTKLETDGQLFQLQKEKEKELLGELVLPQYDKVDEVESVAVQPKVKASESVGLFSQGGLLGNLFGGILGNWSLDDLILIGLTLYLLADKNESNDLLVILLVLLLT